MDFTISGEWIMGFCALITTLWAVWKIIKEIKKPNEDLKRTVEKHDALLNSDNTRLKEMEESNRMILRCLHVIINHNITGNGIEKMKSVRDELNDFLIENK